MTKSQIRRQLRRALVIAGALAATPAAAWVDGGRAPPEEHDIWGMTCTPVDNDPFQVTTSDSVGGFLLIEGRNGVVRKNEIEQVKNITVHGIKSFVVIANGFDYNGRHREIELNVSKVASMLAVNRNMNDAIPCGSAHGVSND